MDAVWRGRHSRTLVSWLSGRRLVHGKASSQQWWGHRWEEIWVINFRTRADGKAGGFTVQNLPPPFSFLPVSRLLVWGPEQSTATRAGSSSPWSTGNASTSLFLLVLAHVCICTCRGVGSEALTLMCRYTYTLLRAYLSSFPGCPVSTLQLRVFFGDGLSVCEGSTLARLGGGVIAGALPGLAGLLPDCRGLRPSSVAVKPFIHEQVVPGSQAVKQCGPLGT